VVDELARYFLCSPVSVTVSNNCLWEFNKFDKPLLQHAMVVGFSYSYIDARQR
jgi:hypothetical protein